MGATISAEYTRVPPGSAPWLVVGRGSYTFYLFAITLQADTWQAGAWQAHTWQ